MRLRIISAYAHGMKRRASSDRLFSLVAPAKRSISFRTFASSADASAYSLFMVLPLAEFLGRWCYVAPKSRENRLLGLGDPA